jgi:hypothetical protein
VPSDGARPVEGDRHGPRPGHHVLGHGPVEGAGRCWQGTPAWTMETGQLAAGEDDRPRRLVISSDFCSVDQSAGKKADGLVNLYCWAHIRRYFVRAGDANPPS